MKKNMAVAMIAGVLLAAGISMANAADNTIVVIKGRVSAVTCDLGPIGLGAGNTLDLGTFAPTAFVDGATTVGSKSFSIGMTQCAGTGTGGKLGLKVTGGTMAGHQNIFSDNGGQLVGVQLKSGAAVLSNGSTVDTTITDMTTFTGASVPFTAGMIAPLASATAHPSAQDVQATLTFVADYQ